MTAPRRSEPPAITALAALRPRMLRYARRQLDAHRAEDAVSDALLAALQGLGGFRGESSLATWAIGILKHKIVDEIRAKHRHASVPAYDGEHPVDEESPRPEPLAGEDSDPLYRLQQRRLLARVEQALAHCPPQPARVFVLSRCLGYHAAEVARMEGVTANHCHVMVHRIERRLRDTLG
jgi:RNA polymerase sigma-70 factor, ECF subfamily